MYETKWTVHEDSVGSNPDITIVNEHGHIIADIGGGYLQARRIYAGLIAAAPDLLAACDAVVAMAECEDAADWKDAKARLASLCQDAAGKARRGAP